MNYFQYLQKRATKQRRRKTKKKTKICHVHKYFFWKMSLCHLLGNVKFLQKLKSEITNRRKIQLLEHRPNLLKRTIERLYKFTSLFFVNIIFYYYCPQCCVTPDILIKINIIFINYIFIIRDHKTII